MNKPKIIAIGCIGNKWNIIYLMRNILWLQMKKY